MAEREKILEVRDLSISFTTTGGELNAIRGVDLCTAAKRWLS